MAIEVAVRRQVLFVLAAVALVATGLLIPQIARSDPHLVAGCTTELPNGGVVAAAATPSGKGYIMATSDGHVATYGDASCSGAPWPTPLNGPIVAAAANPGGGGYWLLGSDGGVFSFGLPFYGSTGNLHLNKPVVGMAPQPDGRG